MDLNGKAALISGAGGGICRAIAVAFAEAGASVACADIDAGSAEETARLVRAAGGEAVAQRCNVADEAEVRAVTIAAQRRSAGSTSWSAARRRTTPAARWSTPRSPSGRWWSTST